MPPNDNPFTPPVADVTYVDRFPTRFGSCTVTVEDGIRLVNDSPRGLLSRLLTGSSMWRLMALYLLVEGYLWFAALGHLIRGQHFAATFEVACAVWFIFAIIKARGFTRAMHIPHGAVSTIEGHAGRRWLTVPRVVVTYDDDGTCYKRMIQLPGALYQGGDALEHAMDVFKKADLVNDPT